MRHTSFVLIFFLTFLSCAEATKNKTPEEVFQQTISQLEQAETLSYEVDRIFANEQREMNVVYKIQKAGYEPHLGFFFYKEMDSQTKIYYKLASLVVVEDNKEKITVFDYGNDRSIPRYLKAYTEDEDNLLQVLKLLQEGKNDVEFLKEDKIENSSTYLYQVGTALIWLDKNDSLPVKLALNSSMITEGTINKKGDVRKYSNIVLNKEMSDDDFTAEENENYVTTHFGVKAEPLLNSMAANWEFQNLNGETVSLSDYKGQNIFLEAWISSCHHCIASIPKVKEIESRFGNKLKVVTVNFDYDKEVTNRVVESHNIDYTVLLGNAQFDKDYDIRSFPSYYVIDKNGRIIYTNRGSISGEKQDELFAVLERLQ